MNKPYTDLTFKPDWLDEKPFGEEWHKEMMKWKKADLVYYLANVLELAQKK